MFTLQKCFGLCITFIQNAKSVAVKYGSKDTIMNKLIHVIYCNVASSSKRKAKYVRKKELRKKKNDSAGYFFALCKILRFILVDLK